MLKVPILVKELEREAVDRLSGLFAQIPGVRLGKMQLGKAADDLGVDLAFTAAIGGERYHVLVECKSSGQPRYVRPAILQLCDRAQRVGKRAAPVLVAPTLSEQVQSLCREKNVGFLDLEGNARLAFGSVFIERLVTNRSPSAPLRELKSLYKPKAAQVLRVLLREPGRLWRTIELAEAASVSLGHVSNVRTQLLDREWAQASAEGLSLIAPGALLDDWRESYDAKAGARFAYYTTLHGEAFESAARAALGRANRSGRAAFSSFSAAQWLAPYARTATQSFVADDAGFIELQSALHLESTTRGENVTITRPRDPGVFLDAVQPVPGVFCTSPVQTYLDLASAGERGQEAAEHLRLQKLKW